MTHYTALRNPAPPISTATVRERPVAPENGASLRAMMYIPVSSSPFTPRTGTSDRR